MWGCPINIETDRYYGVNIVPSEERLCEACNSVENEIHGLMKCHLYRDAKGSVLILSAPFQMYLQIRKYLLHICNEYAAEHQLIYNGSKTFSLCFKKIFKISSLTYFLDQTKIPLVEQCRYFETTISIKNSD